MCVVTRDYHPIDHASFTTHGGPFPPHCVQGSRGAELCVPVAAALASARAIGWGGAPLRDDLPVRLAAHGVRLLATYGQTETAGYALGGAPGDSLRGDAAIEAAKRAFRVPPALDYEFAYDEDAHANATVYVDPVSNDP